MLVVVLVLVLVVVLVLVLVLVFSVLQKTWVARSPRVPGDLRPWVSLICFHASADADGTLGLTA